MLPIWITVGVVVLLWLVGILPRQLGRRGVLEPLELMAFDWRARLAVAQVARVAPNLGVIYVDEDSLAELNERALYRWPLPRHLYGHVVNELRAQGAKAVAFDLLFLDLDRDYAENRVNGLSSDAYFAASLAAARNVAVATSAEDIRDQYARLRPLPDLFRTNAWAVAHDGVRGTSRANAERLREVPAFIDDARLGRVWHLGLLLGARQLDLDLSQAVIEPGRIRLANALGLSRVIPVDAANRFYVDWVIGPEDSRVEQGPLMQVLEAADERRQGRPVRNLWQDRAVLVGSAAIGSNVSDWGATPLAPLTPLCLSHVNAANSLVLGRFIARAGPGLETLIVGALAVLTGLLGWRLRALWATLAIGALAAAYTVAVAGLYVGQRLWLPLALPLTGSVLMTYACMLSYRLVIEHLERRQVRSLFGKMVSPNVFGLLLQQPVSRLGGARRPVSVYFADVRGFTAFVEDRHACSRERLRGQALEGPAAEAVLEVETRETLDTINLYLGLVADTVKAYDGTLDKYIGDCVMAFWGAPLPVEGHALACVKAAIAVHKAVYALNQGRQAENQRREREKTGGQADRLPILRIGSAIHSGVATAGFMGSAAHVSNYTVFGRDVNIASRLEQLVGADRIFVSQATYAEVRREAPELAATFIALPSAELRGIPEPIAIYEVPWQSAR